MDYGRPHTAAEPAEPAVTVHDRGWVPASPDQVHRVLASVATYPSWWRAIRMQEDISERHLALSVSALGDVSVSVEGDRPGVGLILQVSGDVHGVLEWFLEPFKEGTVVNVFLRLAERPRRWRRRERAYRAAVRDGLVSLRTVFEDRATARGRRGAPADGR